MPRWQSPVKCAGLESIFNFVRKPVLRKGNLGSNPNLGVSEANAEVSEPYKVCDNLGETKTKMMKRRSTDP